MVICNWIYLTGLAISYKRYAKARCVYGESESVSMYSWEILRNWKNGTTSTPDKQMK